ncbi:MAG: DUF3592 domain-containing protein [Pirellulaceae bacterium]|nr:DUF3592 domain-containing protein [Planctomycetales bacterium]
MATKRLLNKALGFALIGGIVAALTMMSVLTVYGGSREAIRILRGQWNTTNGQVMSSFISTSRRGSVLVVEYEYRVERNTYRGYHQSDKKQSNRLGPGQSILIYYDQERPFLSYGEEHPRKQLPEAVGLIVVGLTLFVPSGTFGLLLGLSLLRPTVAIRLLELLTGLFARPSIKK